MKKVFIGIVLLLLILGIFCGCKDNSAEQSTKVGTFSLYDYEWEMEEFSQDISVDPIKNAEDAIKCAKSIWEDFYNYDDDIEECTVYYDRTSNMWLVCGTLAANEVGGVPYVIIDATENVAIAVWHEK